MLKVCHMASGDLWAGAEVMVYQLLRELSGYPDLSIRAILLNEGKLSEKLREIGVPIFVFDEKQHSFVTLARLARQAVGEFAPNVIHSHRYKENILACCVAGKRKSVRLISTQHGKHELKTGPVNLKYRIFTAVNKWVLSRRFDYIVAVSGELQGSLHDFPRVRTIHNGIVINDVPDPEIPLEKHARRRFTIGSAGRLFPVKDYPFMVEIARETVKRDQNILFELAGDGPGMDELVRLISNYGLEENFKLRGFVTDTPEFYSGLDVFLNTSLHEGIPMSILEAMERRLPIIAPEIGGLKEIVEDGRTGYLVSNRDPRVFAEKCLELRNKEDLRKNMASAAREKVVSDFSARGMARAYYGLYSEMV